MDIITTLQAIIDFSVPILFTIIGLAMLFACYQAVSEDWHD